MIRERTKEILKEHEIRLSKRHGQSHLVDPDILKRIVEYAEISPSDVVLEVGPGIGNLTDFLAERAGRVIAVESDDRLIEVLRGRLGDRSNLDIIRGDVLEIDLPGFDKVVANLPYSISSPFTFQLLERDFDLGILMYQKEFAQRMVASPGSSDYSRLSVNVAYHARVSVLEEVPPSAFIPQPEVWSAVVKVNIREPPFEVRSEDLLFRTVRAAFQHRRQKIRNSLLHSFEEIFPEEDISDDKKREFIDEAIPTSILDRRAADLSLQEFGKIADCLGRKASGYK